MTNDLEEAIARIRNNASELFVAPEAHRAAVQEGLGQAERREFVGDDEMAKLWKKCGL
jgi:predicted transcriptional regulator